RPKPCPNAPLFRSAAARSEEKIRAWAGALPAEVGGRVTAARLDLADLASVEALVERLIAEGGVDILVNNSGGPPPADAREAKRGDWLVQFEAMAANLFHLTQRLLPGLL